MHSRVKGTLTHFSLRRVFKHFLPQQSVLQLLRCVVTLVQRWITRVRPQTFSVQAYRPWAVLRTPLVLKQLQQELGARGLSVYLTAKPDRLTNSPLQSGQRSNSLAKSAGISWLKSNPACNCCSEQVFESESSGLTILWDRKPNIKRQKKK